ncbi:unnamed protein product [Microthlaspi erraticum]|uniref:CCHC-type domain-containing protein n=1 Tax=Microthlaspi erraticum TaxID=1685480 RepID=A0A6D2IWW5_9BRAS|nr:unnamed protein product [Microthlaspi erraticum]
MDPAAPPQFLDQYENPYFLHNSDHAGLVLVSDRLQSRADFHAWRRSVRMTLNVRNKLGFVDGTVPKPPVGHRDVGSWSCCNDMVATWLMNSVSKSIGQSLLFMNTAKAIWNNLLARFKQNDAPRVYEIEQRLACIQQGPLDISAYYTELMTLSEEYKNYVELPVCTCGRCECNAAILWEQLQQRSRVTKFLMGLNETYESSRRHILMLKPIPSIEDVFNMVAQDERQRSIRPTSKLDNVVFQSSGPSDAAAYDSQLENGAFATQHQNNYRSKQRPVCTYCGQLGHIVQKCFKIHGYPPGHKLHNSTMASDATQPASYGRGQPNSAPRNQNQSQFSGPHALQKTNAVANVMTGSSPFLSSPATNAVNIDLSQISQD